ncbi:hypothetical protein KOW79_005102 [Hemibagrus wyckioides]|uniref:Uncharacterized protein n=1 Tax=Hemibagrus wyckioides TaxID=337641 RepID=A0A9D3NY43_9TELE|nr:hypothetical protein KOW79_005102 [Hemibagrus wyckioides]
MLLLTPLTSHRIRRDRLKQVSLANGERKLLSVEPKGKPDQSIYKIPFKFCIWSRAHLLTDRNGRQLFSRIYSLFRTPTVCTAFYKREKRD